MGYFSNGTEGESYRVEYCSQCIHDQADGGCSVWLLHMLNNYAECNKPDSYLHVLIPRSKDGLSNEACSMFVPTSNDWVNARSVTHCLLCNEPYHGGPCKERRG